MKKRILSILLAISLMVPAMPAAAAEIPEQTGIVTETEQTPEETVSPEASEVPETTVSPEASETPEETVSPEASETPEETVSPEASEVPEETVSPEASETPEAVVPSATPEAAAPTKVPEATAVPTPEAVPGEIPSPGAAVSPVVTPSPSAAFETQEPEETDELLGSVETEVVAECGVGPAYEGIYTEEDIKNRLGTKDTDELVAASEDIVVLNSDVEVINYLKSQMKVRNTEFSMSTAYSSDYSIGELIDAAMDEKIASGSDEGDYILANFGGYNCYYRYNGEQYIYAISMLYMDTAEQEAQVASAVRQAFASLNLNGKTEYEKILAIHDFVVERIEYTDDGTDTCHSTYAAIVEGKAVCQGYASLFYRMCKEAGIPVRYITGYACSSGDSEPHAWNIVKLGDYWYNVDTTWDDSSGGGIYYNYFLKSDEDFSDHYRNADYRTGSFYEEYPMAPVSWSALNQETLDADNSQFNYTFNGIDGETLSTQSSKKAKILVFFRTTCPNSQQTLKSISQSDWIKSGQAEVYALEFERKSLDEVEEFKDIYCPEGYINFGYDDVTYNIYYAMWAYAGAGGFSSSVTLPVIAMIDENNKLQFVTIGYQAAATISSAYLPKLITGYNPSQSTEIYPVTSVNIREYSAAGYVGSSLYTVLPAGSSKSLAVGDVLYINGVGRGASTNFTVNSKTSAAVSNQKVITYDAATSALKAVGGGSATITFTSVSNPEVSAKLNITVKGAEPTPTPTPTKKPSGSWPFIDVAVNAGNWKYENIKFVYENGIMTGVKTDEFRPDEPLTRAMFASVIYRLAGEPAVSYKSIFSDVPAGKWYSNAIIWAYENGIVAGLGNGRYGINDNITREQMARMLMEFAKVQGYDTSDRADFSKFADSSQVSRWAYENMQWAVGAGIISGSTRNGKYYMNPKGQATRAECAVMLTKFIQKYR